MFYLTAPTARLTPRRKPYTVYWYARGGRAGKSKDRIMTRVYPGLTDWSGFFNVLFP